MTVYVDETADEKRKRLAREASQRYRAAHPERVKENARAAYAADPQRAMDRHRRWYQENKGKPAVKAKSRALARKSYQPRRERQILEATGGQTRPSSCSVCGGSGRICFDHCHASGAFRGWLCHHCNLILGHAKDDSALLRKLADYLDRSTTTGDSV